MLRLPVVERRDLDAVARQLGREPRGVLEIAYRCPNGEPGVVKTTPVCTWSLYQRDLERAIAEKYEQSSTT